MTTIKLNSHGKEVQILQSLLKVTPIDGSFGSKTLEALKAFQRSHKDPATGKPLTPDGICGPKTWAALGILTAADLAPLTSGAPTPSLPITIVPLSLHITPSPNRLIKYIAIHYTAGTRSTQGAAKAVKHVFETAKASADYCVDDHDILQFNPNPKNYYCWAVGDKKNPYNGGATLYGKASNSNTISIEICSTLQSGATAAMPNHSGWSFSEAAFNNAVALTRYLMQKYNIPLDHVVRHYDITGKLCPGIPGWNNGPIYTPQGQKTTTPNHSRTWKHFLTLLHP